jgi:hypothetical protein
VTDLRDYLPHRGDFPLYDDSACLLHDGPHGCVADAAAALGAEGEGEDEAEHGLNFLEEFPKRLDGGDDIPDQNRVDHHRRTGVIVIR